MRAALMTRQRRALAPVILAVLGAIGLATPFLPIAKVSALENRVLASAPAWPSQPQDWRRLPRRLDAYLADHFAFREPLVLADMRLLARLGGREGPADAVEGRGGWMFLSDGLLQSTGRLSDPEAVADYADFVCGLRARVEARGGRLLFAPVPSPAEIYPEHAPAWAGPPQRPTDLDRVLAKAAACGVATLDLRPALLAAKPQGRLYRTTDSHWTPRGALVAYNAMATALGHTGWTRDPQALAWVRQIRRDGDLPRLARQEARPEVFETYPDATVHEEVRRPIEGASWSAAAPYALRGAGGRERLLVVGDSFTADSAGAAFAPFVAAFAWVHQDQCAFDRRILQQVRPDLVILAPAEREMRCRAAWRRSN
jgi:hypothetical protein